MAPSTWAGIRNTFAPFDPVPPSKLDQWFVTRPDSPLEKLALLFSPDDLPERHILVGQPASGKSSELTKLAAELKQRYDSLVVRFDMTDNTDVERANPVEIIFLMGMAVFKVAAVELPEDRQPDLRLLENLKQGLETLVRTHTENREFEVNLDKLLKGLVVFGGMALAGPVGGATGVAVAPGVAQAARTVIEKFFPFRFTSGTNVEIVRKLEVEPHVETMIDALNAIISDVQLKADRPLVLLVDGLDKLRDPDVINLNFLEKKFLNGPKCGVLYTGPLEGKAGIEKQEAAKALNELRRQLMAQLTPDYHKILQTVREQHQRVDEEGQGERCDLLLRNDVVLSYVNDDIWFDAHAALTEKPW